MEPHNSRNASSIYCATSLLQSSTLPTSEYLLFAYQAVWVLKSKVFGQESTAVK